jgi:hypothetical protein
MTFELLEYTDSPLGSLELSSHRKAGMEDLVPCKASNFAGSKDEYIRKMGVIFETKSDMKRTSA